MNPLPSNRQICDQVSDLQSEADPVMHNDTIQLFADIRVKQIQRLRKSLHFRAKRRDQKLKQFGNQFNVRSDTKNVKRQVAAIKRKRDETGKFLDGPRKRPCFANE